MVPEETFTHSPLSWSSTIHTSSASFIYHDPWHPRCSIYVLDGLSAQPLSKSSLVYLLVWTLYFILHTFLHPIISFFCNTCPYHLTILISARWSATSFSFLTGQVSLPCNILLHTQLLYSLPLIINDISILVSNGTNCVNLFHSIRILASKLHQHLHPYSCHLNSKTSPLTPDLQWHQILHSWNLCCTCIYKKLLTNYFKFTHAHNLSTLHYRYKIRQTINNTILLMAVHCRTPPCSMYLDISAKCFSRLTSEQYTNIHLQPKTTYCFTTFSAQVWGLLQVLKNTTNSRLKRC